jgi:hypothetical protein
MNKYIGLDAHSASCTVAVVGPSGRHLSSQVLETNGKALIEFVRSVPGTKHLCPEKMTQTLVGLVGLVGQVAPRTGRVD